jgi:hypothetical protein
MTRYLPSRFITRPVTIDAIQYFKENCGSIHTWIGQPHLTTDDENENLCGTGIYLSDEDIAYEGDWICRDYDGFFVVTNEVFQTGFRPLRRVHPLRQWIVTAIASLPEGRVVNMEPMSRHFTLRSAERAMAKYSTAKNPNERLVVNYQIDHAGETIQ